MTALFVLTFDLALYYSVVLYLLDLFAHIRPDPLSFLLFFLMIVLESLRISRLTEKKGLKYILLCIPVLSFFQKGMLLNSASVLPVYGWLAYLIISERYDFSYGSFKDLCGKLAVSVFLVYLAFFWYPGFLQAVADAAMYLAAAWASAVCTLRYLRQNRTGGMISASLCVSLILFSLYASYTRLFHHLIALLRNVYLYLVSRLFDIGSHTDLTWIDDIEIPEAEIPLISGEAMESGGNVQVSLPSQIRPMSLAEKIMIAAVIVLIVAAVSAVLFSSLKGSKAYRRQKQTEEVEKISPRKKAKLPVFAPSDPRAAVRWYYAKYLRECRKCGIPVDPADTSRDIADVSSEFMSARECEAFRELYIRSRYSSQPVSKNDVQNAKNYLRNAKNAFHGRQAVS